MEDHKPSICRICGNLEVWKINLKSTSSAWDEYLSIEDSMDSPYYHIDTYSDFYHLISLKSFDSEIVGPSKLCEMCSNNLIAAYKFMRMIYDAEEKLQLMAKENTKEMVDPLAVTETINEVSEEDCYMKTEVVENDITQYDLNIEQQIFKDDIEMEEVELMPVPESVQQECSTSNMKICDVCRATFKTLESYQEHLPEHEIEHSSMNIGSYVCHACDGIKFRKRMELWKHQLDTHMTTINNLKTCDICYRSFLKCARFLKHMKVHNKALPVFKCRICNEEEFSTSQEYLQHKREKHRTKAYFEDTTCKNCNQQFKTVYNLRKHMKKICHQNLNSLDNDDANDDKKHKCIVCNGLGFGRRTELVKHYHELHMSKIGKMIKCNICGKELSKVYSFLKHIRTHREAVKSFKCALCADVEFKTEEDYLSHKSDYHTIQEDTSENKCKYCDKVFMFGYNLRKHLEKYCTRIKLGSKIKSKVLERPTETLNSNKQGKEKTQFSCDQCDKVFTTKNPFLQHLRRHYDSIFDCEYCDTKFVNEKELIIHKRFHTRDFPFICEICARKFAVISHLKAHLLRHQEIKFECEICGKKFSTNSLMREHRLIHMGPLPFPCSQCDRAYTSKRKYKRHLKGCHKIELPEEEWKRLKPRINEQPKYNLINET